MILNSHAITYLVCSFISFVIGFFAVVSGFLVWKKWDITSQAEEQYRLEKKVYLIITVLSLGFILKLLMIPLWFWTLYSMIPSVPGAMCLVGIHNIAVPVSYIASTLKFVTFFLCGYWLLMNHFDRKIIIQPFMKPKMIFLIPLGFLILCETILDISFLLSVPPRQISCCTSLFDVPEMPPDQMITSSTWVWVTTSNVLFLFIIGEVLWFIFSKKAGPFMKGRLSGNKYFLILQTLFIAMVFIIFIQALQINISPVLLGIPLHHCIFCLCQKDWVALLSVSIIFMGLILFLFFSWFVSMAEYGKVYTVLEEKMVILLKFSGVFLGIGVIILFVHLLIVLHRQFYLIFGF